MRIIGGQFRGRKLISPLTTTTRPTSDRARESLFNLIENDLRRQEKKWDDCIFADIFAGTGAVGVEAVSRGAKHVFFFENNFLAQKTLRQNTQEFKNTHIYADALNPPSGDVVDILFLDPPYHQTYCEKSILSFQKKGWISKKTLIICETDKNETVDLIGFDCLDKRSYGRNTFWFYRLS